MMGMAESPCVLGLGPTDATSERSSTGRASRVHTLGLLGRELWLYASRHESPRDTLKELYLSTNSGVSVRASRDILLPRPRRLASGRSLPLSLPLLVSGRKTTHDSDLFVFFIKCRAFFLGAKRSRPKRCSYQASRCS